MTPPEPLDRFPLFMWSSLAAVFGWGLHSGADTESTAPLLRAGLAVSLLMVVVSIVVLAMTDAETNTPDAATDQAPEPGE